MHQRLISVLLINTLFAVSQASAHYLWVVIDKTPGDAAANIYFEESPAAGDGHYLEPFVKSGKTWIRTVENVKPQLLAAQEIHEKPKKKRWLVVALPHTAPRSVDSYGKFGVYRYGKTDVLLHYYARNLDVQTHEDLHELARAKQMELDIVPHDEGDELSLSVFWRGAPAAKRLVYVRGPKGFRQNVKTDDRGKLRIKIKTPGKYLFRTYVEENKAGQDGGKDYSAIRHHATMAISLPLKK